MNLNDNGFPSGSGGDSSYGYTYGPSDRPRYGHPSDSHGYGYSYSYSYVRDDVCGPASWGGCPGWRTPCDDSCLCGGDPGCPGGPHCGSRCGTDCECGSGCDDRSSYSYGRSFDSRHGYERGSGDVGVHRVVVVHGDSSDMLRDALVSSGLVPALVTAGCVIWVPSQATQPGSLPHHAGGIRARANARHPFRLPPTNRPEEHP